MFHVSVRVRPKIVRGRTFVHFQKISWIPDTYGLKCINTSSDVVYLEKQIRTAASSALIDIWNKSIELDKRCTLNSRFELYERVRGEGMHDPQFEWCTSIIGCLPLDAIRYADMLFAVELLSNLKRWPELHRLILDLSRWTPLYWEQLMLSVLEKSTSDMLAIKILELFGECCVNQKIDISKLKSDEIPTLQICRAILNRFNSSEIVESLDQIGSTNLVLANTLSTALSRTQLGSLINVSKLPSPIGRSARIKSACPNNSQDLTERLWYWKLRRDLVSAEDLKVYMLYLVYNGRSSEALKVHDKYPNFHEGINFNETVLLAAAGAGNYSRLQSVFEEVEQNPALIEKLGSRRYAIVLSALSYLGDAGVVGDIYQKLLESRPELLTRGVYHALIQSHSIRGDPKSARKVYDAMVDHGVKPNYTTFGLVLEAYRSSLDLKRALMFVGDELISQHQHALRNQELTMLLSLCGKRRDYKSAKFVWEWGNTLLKPDRIAYNTYLHVLVSANEFDSAWSLYEEIENRFTLKTDTLTIMLNAAGRSKNIEQFTSNIIAKKNELQLKSDEGWYVSLLSALAESGNLDEFEKSLKEMKKEGIKANASHHSLHLNLLAKSKQFAREYKYSQEMREAGIPINFAFIEQQLRHLVAPGSSQESQQSAHAAALALVRDGYFDPSAAMAPRGVIPVRVIEPVVMSLVKSGQFVSAKHLLDGLRQQRAEEPSMRDENQIWALYMTIAEKSSNYAVINQLWTQFKTVLPNVYVLSEPANFSSESGDASNDGGSKLTKKPVLKVAARYKKDFSKPVGVWIRQLERTRDLDGLLNLPKELEAMGLAFNGGNVNSYIIALVTVDEINLAFEIANSARSSMRFNLSARAEAALASVVHRINYHRYGGLGHAIYLKSRRSKGIQTANI